MDDDWLARLHGGLFWLHEQRAQPSLKSVLQPLICYDHVFNSNVSSSSNKNRSLYHLWRQRLGHPPDSKIKHITQVSNVPYTTEPCFVCPRAKMKRLPFPLRTPSSSQAFNLIHIDTWGPRSTPNLQGNHYFLTLVLQRLLGFSY